VLLTSEAEYATWLDPELIGREPFEALFAPLPPERLEKYAAGEPPEPRQHSLF
jgi:hypothetical protein